MSADTSSSGSADTDTDTDTDKEKYIIFGMDFKDFLGTGIDLSGIIDTIGGALNFEISSILSCLLSIFSIIILLLVTTGNKGKKSKGLEIPGIGILGPQQPLVIQMPMQTVQYPFNLSSFPRNT